MAESWSRRQVLVLGASTPLLLAGCTLSDPAVRTDPVGTPEPNRTAGPVGPSPTGGGAQLPAAVLAAVEAEQRIAAQAEDLLHRAGAKLSKREQRRFRFFRDAHRAHAAALAALGGGMAPAPTSPSTPSARTATSARVARDQAKAAKQCRAAALQASGREALIWGAIAVSDAAYARSASGAATARSAGAPTATTVLSDVAAAQERVRQLHAAIYGYQLAIGQLKVLGAARQRALRELSQLRTQLNSAIGWLTRRSAAVPAAAAAYDPPLLPKDERTSGLLIRQIQTGLQPFYGLWLVAASTTRERRQALDTLANSVALAGRWGAPLATWPGFPAP